MTSLPQSTQQQAMVPVVRGGSAGALAYPTVGLAAAASAGTRQMTAGDFLRVIRLNFWLIFILLVVSGIIGYGLNRLLLTHAAQYTAFGFVQIDTQRMENPVSGRVSEVAQADVLQELRTHAQLLKSEELFSKLISDESGPVRETDWYRQFGNDTTQAKVSLASNIRVEPIPDSKLLRVSMSTRQPKDAKTIVERLVESHMQEENRSAKARLGDRRDVLNDLQKTYAARIRDKAETIRNLQLSLYSKGMSNPGRFSSKEQELSELIATQFKVQTLAGEARSMFDQMSKQIEAGQLPPQVSAFVENDPQLGRLSGELVELNMYREQQLLRMSPEHPQIKQVDKRIELLKKKTEELRKENTQKRLSEMMGALRDAVEKTDADRRSVDKRVSETRAEIAGLTNEMASLMAEQDEEKALRELQRQVNDQLRDLDSVQTWYNPSRVHWATHGHPIVPESPSFPKLPITMGASVLLGLAIALGIAFLREALDETVRTPADLARLGSVNLLGVIPDDRNDPKIAAARLPLVIFEAPNSVTADQFRQIRTRLQRTTHLDSARSLMVTGPGARAGKTTVVCNLAVGLALNGRRILLVDADFRRPEIHRVFGFVNDSGFGEVLAGKVPLVDRVRQTPIPNLDVLTSGGKPSNPTELFESHFLSDFLAEAGKSYDHVIFDTGPVLIVSESVALATRLDGVVVVARAHRDRRGMLSRTIETLRQVNAPLLGVVLNGVRTEGMSEYRGVIKTYYEYQKVRN